MNTPTKSDSAAYVGAEGVSPTSVSGWTPDNGAGDVIMKLFKLGVSMGLDVFDLLVGWVLGFGFWDSCRPWLRPYQRGDVGQEGLVRPSQSD
jgi:hypothetical protein